MVQDISPVWRLSRIIKALKSSTIFKPSEEFLISSDIYEVEALGL